MGLQAAVELRQPAIEFFESEVFLAGVNLAESDFRQEEALDNYAFLAGAEQQLNKWLAAFVADSTHPSEAEISEIGGRQADAAEEGIRGR